MTLTVPGSPTPHYIRRKSMILIVPGSSPSLYKEVEDLNGPGPLPSLECLEIDHEASRATFGCVAGSLREAENQMPSQRKSIILIVPGFLLLTSLCMQIDDFNCPGLPPPLRPSLYKEINDFNCPGLPHPSLCKQIDDFNCSGLPPPLIIL